MHYDVRLDESSQLEPKRPVRVEILLRPNRVLVTVLELLCPATKSEAGLKAYCAKRQAILHQKVHLVELDFLVGGQRMPLAEPLPEGDFALVSRADGRRYCEVFAWSIRRPLPTIPIPLKAPDADVHVDLQAVFRQTYERGRYWRSLNYSQAPFAPLADEDKTWAMEQARKK
ncbi:MAG: DUF4058 family protein [Gemmataceae bacterium]|nr:DUF4058 family protein [Gemmataceae bacterium]MCI0737499.1 DUF4058 family protein [Gemmataceae bacterium]